MLKTNIKQKGFTIVELLIVIVIIGILGLLVLNTVTGAQKRARDADRQSDVNALATQLEVYYNDKGGYPQYSQIDTAAEATAAFPGLDENALKAPQGTDFDLKGAASANPKEYGYVALNGAAACATDDACTSFTLSYNKEDVASGATSLVEKKSLNN